MTEPDRPRRRLLAIASVQIALSLILFGGAFALLVWARRSGHSTGRLLVVGTALLIALLAIFGVVAVTIGRRRRGR